MPGNAQLLIRSDTSTNWSTTNPVLALKEVAYDRTANKLKVGDGVLAWNALGYVTATAVVADGDKGDITVSAAGTVWTIDNGAVSLAKQADMATSSLVYRKTAAAGAPEVNTLATLKTDLGLTGTNSGDQTSIVGITGTIAQFNTAITDGDMATGGGTATGTNTGDQTTITGQAGSVANSVTFTNSDVGDASGTAFNGSVARTINYITVGGARSSLFATGAFQGVRALDARNYTNPTTSLGYGSGVRFRFSSLNDDSISPYADVIDFSTYFDSTGGGFNALYLGKNSQILQHKHAAAGATSWTTKTLAYTDSPTFTGTVSAATITASGPVTGSNLSGTNTGDQTITLTGNVTGSGTGSFAATIPANTVTLAMQADMATASVVYRKTAAAGAPEVQTLATLKTDLGLTGTNSGDQTITLTGNVTGSGSGSFAATIANSAVTYAKMQDVSAVSRLLGRGSAAGVGAPEEIVLGTNLSMSGTTLNATGGGSGLTLGLGQVLAIGCVSL